MQQMNVYSIELPEAIFVKLKTTSDVINETITSNQVFSCIHAKSLIEGSLKKSGSLQVKFLFSSKFLTKFCFFIVFLVDVIG